MTVGDGRGSPTDARRRGAHGLLVAETDRERRVRATAWVERQLGSGAKVLYHGRSDPGAEHWLTGSLGSRHTARARESGQLELLDLDESLERSGGTVRGWHELAAGRVLRALHQGWPRVALTQESPHRPVEETAAADAEGAAQYAAAEAGYDDFARR